MNSSATKVHSEDIEEVIGIGVDGSKHWDADSNSYCGGTAVQRGEGSVSSDLSDGCGTECAALDTFSSRAKSKTSSLVVPMLVRLLKRPQIFKTTGWDFRYRTHA